MNLISWANFLDLALRSKWPFTEWETDPTQESQKNGKETGNWRTGRRLAVEMEKMAQSSQNPFLGSIFLFWRPFFCHFRPGSIFHFLSYFARILVSGRFPIHLQWPLQSQTWRDFPWLCRTLFEYSQSNSCDVTRIVTLFCPRSTSLIAKSIGLSTNIPRHTHFSMSLIVILITWCTPQFEAWQIWSDQGVGPLRLRKTNVSTLKKQVPQMAPEKRCGPCRCDVCNDREHVHPRTF